MDELMIILACLVIAACISGIIMYVVRSKLKSVKSERTACNYTRDGSFRTTSQRDNFLYNSIIRIPRAQNSSRRGRR
ncbi:MAG: hypothetical protein FWF81_07195 [Defluviitaleaceae bacterium]|nr:hypothetical protein [Defluviitaleaceae bacterium]